MSFPYKHVLMVGATAGIGKAMSERLIQAGAKVTVVGRRKERLDEFVQQYGASKSQAVQFDISKHDLIPNFAKTTMSNSPDIDCVFLNAGVQGAYDLFNPKEGDLEKFLAEVNTNFNSFVALTYAFLPLLKSKSGPSSLVYTGTSLALLPAVPMPAYSASKAALNAYIMCLRQQLKTNDSNVKVFEIWPPMVQTELHDYMGEERGRSMGMPVKEFTEQAFEGLIAGKEQIAVGRVGPDLAFNPITREGFLELMEKRIGMFGMLSNMLQGKQP